MRELLGGVYHWSTYHEPIEARVSSYYLQSAGALIDPKIPEEGIDALPGTPQLILLTSGHHHRDSGQLAGHFEIPIRASLEANEYLGGRLEVEVFNDGEEVAPGVTAIHIGRLSDDEGAFHVATGEGAIAFADGVIRYDGRLQFVPDELIGDHPDRVKQGLKEAFRGLLALDFDNLLFAHGEPLVGGGKAALQEFAS